MKHCTKDILTILDKCSEAFSFPMLDNGYVYLAATRLSLYRSSADWAMVIEVFGFSPREGIPNIYVHTFGSRLARPTKSEDFVTAEAYRTYLENNLNNEFVSVYPIEEGEWQDPDCLDLVVAHSSTVCVRGVEKALPQPSKYGDFGISLEEAPTVQVFELCRLLAAMSRDDVLATSSERRQCVPNELDEILVLDKWHHPDLVNGELPSTSPTFNALAQVLIFGDVCLYRPQEKPNTHWANWPDGGTL